MSGHTLLTCSEKFSKRNRLWIAAVGLATLGAAIGVIQSSQAAMEIRTTEHQLMVRGRQESFKLKHYTNEHSEKEVAVEYEEVRRFFPDTETFILYGRDLDGDNRYDAWFLTDEDGVAKTIDMASYREDGWDAVSYIVQNHMDLANTPAWKIVLWAASSKLTLNGGVADHFFKKMLRAQMDLEDIEMRADRIVRTDPYNRDVVEYYLTVADGWTYIAKEAEKGLKRHILWTLGDMLSVVIAAGITKGLELGVNWTGAKIAQSRAGTLIEKAYMRYIEGTISKSNSVLARVGSKLKAIPGISQTVAVSQAAATAAAKLSARVDQVIRTLSAKGKLGYVFAKGIENAIGIAKGSYELWKVQVLGLALERAAKQVIPFGSEPVVLENPVKDDEDLLHEVSKISLSVVTIKSVGAVKNDVLHGIVVQSVNAGKEIGKTYVLDSAQDDKILRDLIEQQRCVEAGNSSEDADQLSAACPSKAWETIQSLSGQTGKALGDTIHGTLDLAILKHFEKLAASRKDSKLVLLGFLLAYVERQAEKGIKAAFGADEKKGPAPAPAPELQWIPIMGPVAVHP